MRKPWLVRVGGIIIQGSTTPTILSTQTPLGSTAVDGTINTGSATLVEHSLSGPLDPHGISILSFDAYAFSDLPSHGPSILLISPDRKEYIVWSADWYTRGAPMWNLNALPAPMVGEISGGLISGFILK